VNVSVLDHGYVKLIETWGSDERIVEAARMSTDKGFLGWGGVEPCPQCETVGALNPNDHLYSTAAWALARRDCKVCQGKGKKSGDEKLLRYLYEHKHHTPFEMAGLTIEVQAPIFVFREWHRHRVPFGYNEMSARYTPLPDVNYVPTVERLMMRGGANKQAQGTGVELDELEAIRFTTELRALYEHAQHVYENALARGVPKELARLPIPVARYSKMRATGNLRGWLGFLTLRAHPAAQWEIQQFAHVVASLVKLKFPRTYELFVEVR
jgi:thymidylate synthase (FAD)